MTHQDVVTHQHVLNRLVDNAFTYLEKGLGEFDAEINFSLLHFYGGVELAVKACLLNEDWKLVVQESGYADWSNFYQGKQRTVTLDVAAKRLAILKSKPIDQQALNAFRTLRTHRNQLAHFFHPSRNTDAEKRRVAKELLRAWHYVHLLLRDPSWATVFRSAAQRIAQINVRLLALRCYLQEVYDARVKTRPDAASFLDCPACHFRALKPETGNAYFDSRCLVCGFTELSHRAIKQGEEIIQGHCLLCGEENCVELADEYDGALCAACGESFTHITTCEFCGESFAGANDETEGDYQTGCSFCDGKLGYLMAKDD